MSKFNNKKQLGRALCLLRRVMDTEHEESRIRWSLRHW